MSICIRPKGSEPYTHGLCFKCSCCGYMKTESHFVDANTDSVFSMCSACRTRSKQCYAPCFASYLVKERVFHEQVLKLSAPFYFSGSSRKVSLPLQRKRHIAMPTPLCIIPRSKWIPTNDNSCCSVVAKPVTISEYPLYAWQKTTEPSLESPVCN